MKLEEERKKERRSEEAKNADGDQGEAEQEFRRGKDESDQTRAWRARGNRTLELKIKDKSYQRVNTQRFYDVLQSRQVVKMDPKS